ncbi:Fis family transcriptional regulator [Desulfuromonas versatilis]|uniref:HTH-type transcriptional regulatory protein TyrR n=1 Tax=Desulfuromonas versatilis TaxID=2802975 RepID=A0ABN6E219_9BACT|nr:sigma 54-interacting transcriptional regulator [Desulfuromonas versatilis]BCR06317.1 Fis family transcriptional regulator [Desulfuromonas versatilis]
MKLRILFSDRVGIVADIANRMAELAASILSMEVDVQHRQAIVYLEVRCDDPALSREGLLTRLRTIPGMLEIATIQTLPQERREKRFQVVLDSISDGILAVDEDGRVAAINRVAQEILDCDASQVLGRPLGELKFSTALTECLTGKTYLNRKRDLISARGRFQFFATGKPIRDSRERIVGAVEILKDMKEVKELANAVVQPQQYTFGDMVGQSPAIQAAIAFAQKIAATDAMVSIRGESGTGKELFASAIHAESGRGGQFVPLNCAALPEQLLESELFGYVGGAFSGARKEGKPGLFEVAREGTIFLDEIAEMPLNLQAKMLRVIQEGCVRRIGGTTEVPVNARIITATNKNLERLVEQNQFREDLYYRINVFPIHIPPLRGRPEDIALLVEHFLFRFNARLGKKTQTLSAEVLAKLTRHHWPGNVRELRNVVERAAILSNSEQIGVDCILFGAELGRAMQAGGPTLARLGEGETLPELMERYEKQLLRAALEKCRSIRQLARQLGVSHTTLLNKMKKHDLGLERK